MEQFYQLLKQYNANFAKEHSDLPNWFFQYTENVPPLYWKTVSNILKTEDRNQSIIEVGAGYGDITALLYSMRFTNIISFERDEKLIIHIKDKISILFDKSVHTINNSYPFELDFTPDIIIQVNCTYTENIRTKADHINQINHIYQINGYPKVFIFESIDDSYDEDNSTFPHYMRLNRTDITKIFPKCQIESFATYKYPMNKVSKTLYKICK